jgi:ABC-type uncharacterized transport system ATPase subunit
MEPKNIKPKRQIKKLKHMVIQVEKLSKRFGDFIAVNDITVDVGKGEIFGFLGANGASKYEANKQYRKKKLHVTNFCYFCD